MTNNPTENKNKYFDVVESLCCYEFECPTSKCDDYGRLADDDFNDSGLCTVVCDSCGAEFVVKRGKQRVL